MQTPWPRPNAHPGPQGPHLPLFLLVLMDSVNAPGRHDRDYDERRNAPMSHGVQPGPGPGSDVPSPPRRQPKHAGER